MVYEWKEKVMVEKVQTVVVFIVGRRGRRQMMVMGALVVGVAVLLLPMLIAGWHLSRNLALFFGGAVFISLAPHFLSSMDLAAFHSSSSSDASTSCLALLDLDAAVVWTGSDGGAVPSNWRWASKPTNPCSSASSYHRATHRSSTRLGSSSPVTPRPGISLFHSSPSSIRIETDLIIRPQPVQAPLQLRGAGHREVEAPRMFWMGMPALVTSMLNTEGKWRWMGPGMWAAYNREVGENRLLRGQGGPLFLLNMALLSRGCGVGCTAHRMHYDRVVYDVALHIMLNALLIQSHQQQQQQ